MGVVKSFRFEMGVATEHLPIFVAGDERDLLNRKSGFEEAARAFVAKIVKVQIFDFQLATLAPERCANRPSIIRKNSPDMVASTGALLFNEGAGIVTCDI